MLVFITRAYSSKILHTFMMFACYTNFLSFTERVVAEAPKLADDSSVIAAINGLSDNEGALLGHARVVGEFNSIAKRFYLHRTGPRSRNYSLKMVWMPERQRSLFAGANHGEPHRINDVWEFDLPALSWVLLYAPDNPRSYNGLGTDYSDVIYQDGILVTKRGGPAVIGHTWWGMTYDPVKRQMLFMNTWVTKQDEAILDLGGDPATRYSGSPLWAFIPESGRWNAIKTSPPSPPAPFGGMLEYVSGLPVPGVIWHMNNWQMRATWLYNSKENHWTDLALNNGEGDFKQQAPSRELIGYYDPKRGIVVAQQGRSTFHLDIHRKRWDKVLSASDDQPDAPFGHDSRSSVYYDPKSGDGLLLDHKQKVVWAYNPDQVAWKKLNPSGQPLPTGDKLLAYFDHTLGVFVVIDDTLVWVYCYRCGSS